MRDTLIENAEQFMKLQKEDEDIQKRIEQLQEDAFSSKSEETEMKARELFSEVGMAESADSKSDQIDELRDRRDEIQDDIEDLRSELLKQIGDIRFPLDGTIEAGEKEVQFPYSEEVSDEVLEGISEVLSEKLDTDDVTIGSSSITVNTDSTDKAIEAVEQRVTKLRKMADELLNAAEYVQALHKRDEKVAGMLYTLKESNTPLSKSEIEERMGLESGDLRGQLYYVLNNDAYLKKNGQEFDLTTTGRRVIEEYVNQYSEPNFPVGTHGENNQLEEVDA